MTLVNGLTNTNKSYDNDFFLVYDPARLKPTNQQVKLDKIKKVCLTNICVDQNKQARSTPLLLGYVSQLRAFLQHLTFLRSQAIKVEQATISSAFLAKSQQVVGHPDLILTEAVLEMATLINAFVFLDKQSKAQGTYKKKKGKRKAKGKAGFNE
ncbi:hypothetical protein FCV25MIE_04145 [Fagus crenata]